MSRAFLFTGQGSQFAGMGKELADTFGSAKAVFEEIDEVNVNFKKYLFVGLLRHLLSAETSNENPT